MAEVIILAQFPSHVKGKAKKETKFCNGDCQAELDIKLFDATSGIRMCKKCKSARNKIAYQQKKKDKSQWAMF